MQPTYSVGFSFQVGQIPCPAHEGRGAKRDLWRLRHEISWSNFICVECESGKCFAVGPAKPAYLGQPTEALFR